MHVRVYTLSLSWQHQLILPNIIYLSPRDVRRPPHQPLGHFDLDPDPEGHSVVDDDEGGGVGEGDDQQDDQAVQRGH